MGGGVFFSVKIFPSVDPGLFDFCEIGKRMAIPKHKISVFANCNRADSVVNSELFGWVKCDEFERFDF